MTPSVKNVSVLTPIADQCHSAYALSLVHMCMRTLASPPKELGRLSVEAYSSTILPFARSLLAETALQNGSTHLLFIDSDMDFPSDMLLRFLQREEDIIGINASSRRPPFRCTAQIGPAVSMTTTEDSTGLEKAYRMGFGVVWVRADVFKAIDKPWFDFEYLDDLGVFRGEDYYFFEKAKAKGFDCLVDQDLSKEILHMGSFGFSAQMTSRMGESG